MGTVIKMSDFSANSDTNPDKVWDYSGSENNILEELSERDNDITPDYLELKNMKNIPVFVYGTLKMGERNHSLLKDCIFLGEASTAVWGFRMYKAEGGFPVVLKKPSANSDSYRIYGEVYLCSARNILDLDYLESNGRMYDRQKHFIFLHEQNGIFKENARASLQCFMYVGVDAFWKDKNIHPVQRSMTEDSRPFYEFRTPRIETKKEEDRQKKTEYYDYLFSVGKTETAIWDHDDGSFT